MANDNFHGTEIFNGHHIFIVTKHFNGRIRHKCDENCCKCSNNQLR